MNICIREPVSFQWTHYVSSITPGMRDAYIEYKERVNDSYIRERLCIHEGYIVYRPDNDPYLPTYIARVTDVAHMTRQSAGAGEGADETDIIRREIHETLEVHALTIPIMDIHDIYVFLVDYTTASSNESAVWIPARSYQAWAYRDFMYDRNRSIKKSYMSRNTSPITYESDVRILANQMVVIPISNILPNIVFNISRNENNSVYFERNDALGSRVRICDNEIARTGFLEFYTRVSVDRGLLSSVRRAMIHAEISAATEVAASITPEETDDEEHQCILCFRYRVNMKFSPCDHQVCCSLCYSKFAAVKNSCPICRAEITQATNV